MKNQDITQTEREKEKLFEEGLLNAILAAREWLDILYKIDLIDENDKSVDNHIRAAKAIEVACKLSNQICILGLDRLGKSHGAVSRSLKAVPLNPKCTVVSRQIDRYALAEDLPEDSGITAKLFKIYDRKCGGLISKSDRYKTTKLRVPKPKAQRTPRPRT